MPQQRINPYLGYNFLVDLGTGESDSILAGFNEVQLPELSIDVVEYRSGNDKLPVPRKLPGQTHYNNLVLKRGLIGALDLYEWVQQVKNGDPNAYRTVSVSLLSEDRTAVAMTWVFTQTFPVHYQVSELKATETQVVIETLELTVQDMRMQ